jgi:site-specific recombinase XerC
MSILFSLREYTFIIESLSSSPSSFQTKRLSLEKITLSTHSTGAVHAAIAVAFADSGVKIEGRHHGGHALRFSLAQRMLDKSTPIPVISETLGHQETDMTRSYVRIDFTHLRQCVLDVPNVSDEFYMQKGGCFYE